MEDKVIEIIEKRTGRKVTPETIIAEIVEDSLSKIELLAEIEEQLKVRLGEQELLEMETVADLLALIK